MRHTRAHSANRRSHHGLSEPRLSTCPDCKGAHIRHSACQSCGRYRGRRVIDVAAKEMKKTKKAKLRSAQAEAERKESAEKEKESARPLRAEALSKK